MIGIGILAAGRSRYRAAVQRASQWAAEGAN
jgi:hypothetical protein